MAANEFTRKTYGKDFDRLSESDRIAALKTMDEGKANFPGFSSAHVLQRAAADHHGGLLRRSDVRRQSRHGRRGRWSVIPGLPATYRDEIKTYFNKKYDKPPQSIADFS